MSEPSEPEPTAGPLTNGDRVAAALVLVALAIASGLLALIGVVLAFFTDSCGVASTTCQAGLVAVGTALAAVVPWLVMVAGTIVVAVRVSRGQRMGKVPWAWLSVALLIAAIGVLIVFIGDGFGT